LANVLKCWAKSILLSQTSMFWLFFIQFSFAGYHIQSTQVELLSVLM
jgi:hypothetical protein